VRKYKKIIKLVIEKQLKRGSVDVVSCRLGKEKGRIWK
jgi:hypothetical protein